MEIQPPDGSHGERAAFARIFLATFAGAIVTVSFLACGDVMSSRRSAPQYSSTSPIKIGDVIYYNLPKGTIKVDGVYDEKKGFTITVASEIVADLNERYELEVNQHYPFFDHNAVLTTDDKGLLKTVNAVSTDRGVEGIGALITAGGQALQFAASAGGFSAKNFEKSSGTPTPTATPAPFHITLDPFKGEVSQTTRDNLFTISVNWQKQQIPACPKNEARDDCELRYAGIMTRLTLPFTVTVRSNDGTEARATVLLPDVRQRYLLSAPRGPLVTSETRIDFVNGSMVTRDIKRPSIGYAILGIPKTILGALVPIPGNVRQAEITRIQNQSTLIKETATLQALEHPTPTPTLPPKATETATPSPAPAETP
jgi:hypothetical protein